MVCIIVELPIDSIQWVVVGENERFELGGMVDRREDFAILWKDAS